MNFYVEKKDAIFITNLSTWECWCDKCQECLVFTL